MTDAQQAVEEPQVEEQAMEAADAKPDVEAEAKAEGEGEAAAPASEDEPAAKKQRTEEAAKEAAEGDAAMADAGAAEPSGQAAAEAPKEAAKGPIKIGYRTFQAGSECYSYFHDMMSKVRKNQNLNEYEFHMVKELVRLGHPDAQRKLGGGLRAIQIRDTEVKGNRTTCFFLVHEDLTEEDVSYRKCVANLFPDMADLTAHYGSSQAKQGGGGRGGRGGGGRGARGGSGGRGGRGRGRR